MNTRFQPVRQPVFLTTLSVALIVSLLMGALSLLPGASSIAQADSGDENNSIKKITICHATGDPKHPYKEITLSLKEGSGHGHEKHADDIIPAPREGCLGTTNPSPTAESTSTLPPTATPIPPTPTATPTLTPTVTSTLQPLPTLTGTPLPQPTDTPTPSKTPVPATATATPTHTNTLVPATATPTRTNTPVPPTATPTRTNTPVPPTATPTRTNTPIPPTATPTPTNTPVSPTATPRPGCSVFGSSDVPKAIPDQNPSGIDSVLTLPSPGLIITRASVRVDRLSHTFDSDLQISLIAPTGLSILIADQVGGDGDNFLGTILDDAGLLPIVNGEAPFTGAFQPDNPLFQVNTLRSAGTWKLHVVDMTAGDVGSLQAWALELCGT